MSFSEKIDTPGKPDPGRPLYVATRFVQNQL